MSAIMEVDRRPLELRPGLTVVPGVNGDGDATYLRLGSRIVRLRGRGARQILALLDGSRSLADICEQVPASQHQTIAGVIADFRRQGLLEPKPAEDAGRQPLLRAITDLGADGSAVLAELAGGRVTVTDDGILGEVVTAALERWGVGRIDTRPLDAGTEDPEKEAVDVTILAHDGSDPRVTERFNDLALRRRMPWLSLRVRGLGARLGPFILPGETPCYQCFRRRLEANSATYEDRLTVRRAIGEGRVEPRPADDLVPGVATMAAELCAFEIVRFYANRVSAAVAPTLYGHFVDYSLAAHSAVPHRVLKLPRCPACGPKASGRPTIRTWMESRDDRAE